MSTDESFVYSIIVTGFALLGVGAAKRMVSGRSALRSGLLVKE